MEIVKIPPAVDALDGPDALMDALSSLKESVVHPSHVNFIRRDKPKSKSDTKDMDYNEISRERVQVALDYYNSNHKDDADYECVKIVSQSPYKAMAQHYAFGFHMNFFARKKDGDSSPVLFYADLLSSPSYEEDEIEWCILNPSPISFDEFRPNGVGIGSSVYHPSYVIRCGYCEDMDKVMAKYELDSDDSDDGIDMF